MLRSDIQSKSFDRPDYVILAAYLLDKGDVARVMRLAQTLKEQNIPCGAALLLPNIIYDDDVREKIYEAILKLAEMMDFALPVMNATVSPLYDNVYDIVVALQTRLSPMYSSMPFEQWRQILKGLGPIPDFSLETFSCDTSIGERLDSGLSTIGGAYRSAEKGRCLMHLKFALYNTPEGQRWPGTGMEPV